jgi:hypothetical protein
MLSPFYPSGSNSQNPLIRSQGGPKFWSELFEEKKIWIIRTLQARIRIFKVKGIVSLITVPSTFIKYPWKVLTSCDSWRFSNQTFCFKVVHFVQCLVSESTIYCTTKCIFLNSTSIKWTFPTCFCTRVPSLRRTQCHFLISKCYCESVIYRSFGL